MPKAKKRSVGKKEKGSWEDSLKDFLFWKKAQGLADSTLSEYNRHVRHFFKLHPDAFSPDKLKSAVLQHLGQDGIKPATYNLRLTYLRHFFSWCITENLLPGNPLQGFKLKKADHRIVDIDKSNLAALLKLPDKKTFTGLRDLALIMLQLDTGIRPGEAFKLSQDDISLRSLEVHIRSEIAKTRVSRTLPITPQTATAIRELIKYRHPTWKNTVPVFCSSEGTVLNRHIWGDRLEFYSKKIDTYIRPYDLRHAFALNYLRNGGNALTLQRTMGHTDLTMTKRYVALSDGDLREQHGIASPINDLLPQKLRVRNIGTRGK